MVDPHANGCPEPEVLAAFVDRGLSLSERARVDAHLASCPQCIALVAGAARTVAELSAHMPDVVVAAEATPWVTRRSLAGALAAAAAVIAVVAAPSIVRPLLERDSGLVSLVDSVGEHRSVLGRLTGGFPHAPLDVPSAGGQDGRAAETDRVQLTAGRIRESFGDRQTPAQLHALGVSHLLGGRYEDAAVSLLAASREQPQNAKYLNDVATVQLERARRGLRPDDLPRALASADRARRIDPTLREAWFNRALALTALSLRDQARSSWTEYLKRDATSPWAIEATSRLDALMRPAPAEAWPSIEQRLSLSVDAASADEAVRTQTTEARNFIETRLLAGWASAVAGGRDGGAELTALRLMAEAMQRVAGDALYRDVVASIDRAESGGNPKALAAAHLAYADAALLFAQDRFADAGPKLAAAQEQLRAAGSPLTHRAAVDRAGTTIVRGDYAGTLALVAVAKTAGLARGYTYLSARASWFEGLVATAQRRIADAQASYEETLTTFERMGDAEQTAVAHNLLASLFFYLGDKENEWRHRTEALKGLAVSRSGRVRTQIINTVAMSVRQDNPENALLLYNEALTQARAGRTVLAIEVLAQRAAALAAAGRWAEASADIAAARAEAAAIPEPRLKETYELLILAPEGEILRQQQPAAAVATASRALELIQRRNNPADRSRIPAFQLQLAKANIVWGNLTAAKIALADGIRSFEAERALVADESRFSTFDQSWELFDTAVQLAIQEKDYPRAFEMAERGRVRTLAEARKATPRALSDAQRGLRAGEAVVALNQFADELAVWVIRREGVDVVRRPMTRVDAARLVARQQDEIWQESSRPTASRDLYNEVVRPVAVHLRGATKLTFVPDATFQDAAFAALLDSTRQKFLVEDVPVSLAPSVDAYLSGRARGADAAVARQPLVIGGPGTGAVQGAQAVGALYSGASIVTGDAATPRRVLEEAPAHSLIHLSTRTTANESNPLLSRLMLADESGRRYSGAVLGTEIAARPLSRTSLVVLDEVETNTTDRGEGTLSLARAFMAAGVPAVLATLPGADDNAARDLLIGFHREMSRSIPAAQALQTVQRNAIQQNGRRLGAWTALVLYGSDR